MGLFDRGLAMYKATFYNSDGEETEAYIESEDPIEALKKLLDAAKNTKYISFSFKGFEAMNGKLIDNE